ncbi:hypothetical protein [Curtobacterium sp. MCBA15_016]|nr:hypothetical protein [Curtobacterium sp. MCBA15_016]
MVQPRLDFPDDDELLVKWPEAGITITKLTQLSPMWSEEVAV